MTVEVVVFDIGNVLIEWQPETFFTRRVGKPRSDAFFATVPIHDIHQSVDDGAAFDVILAAAKTYPEFEPELRIWHDQWEDLTANVISHSVRLMAALQSRSIPVWALTNFGVEPFERSCVAHPFLNDFDGAVVSGQVKLSKPNPAIYQVMEGRLGVPPASILFVDDRMENIHAAVARGWKTHHFNGADTWAQTLVDYGLLTKEEAI